MIVDDVEEVGVGAPGGGGEGAVDLLVFDDVGPVADDPLLALVLLGDSVGEEFAGVVEVEVAGLELRDEGPAVVGGGVEELVELGSSLVQFAS